MEFVNRTSSLKVARAINNNFSFPASQLYQHQHTCIYNIYIYPNSALVDVAVFVVAVGSVTCEARTLKVMDLSSNDVAEMELDGNLACEFLTIFVNWLILIWFQLNLLFPFLSLLIISSWF